MTEIGVPAARRVGLTVYGAVVVAGAVALLVWGGWLLHAGSEPQRLVQATVTQCHAAVVGGQPEDVCDGRAADGTVVGQVATPRGYGPSVEGTTVQMRYPDTPSKSAERKNGYWMLFTGAVSLAFGLGYLAVSLGWKPPRSRSSAPANS